MRAYFRKLKQKIKRKLKLVPPPPPPREPVQTILLENVDSTLPPHIATHINALPYEYFIKLNREFLYKEYVPSDVTPNFTQNRKDADFINLESIYNNIIYSNAKNTAINTGGGGGIPAFRY